ncbi:MAG TPA: radical SAM protein, partial [Rhodoblastus sp.]|nr:radical SAM protein [Rhodoblastus sp.]
GEPLPILPRARVRRTMGKLSSLDFGRGCPYQCSFCTIINVQGRKSRFRNADDLERILRENQAQGVTRFFITDDNFARNAQWEQLFDRIIKLREEENMVFGFTIQVDTLCHKIPNFIEKATRAGANRVFIGLENINPDNLIEAKKRQNKITEYRVMLQKWREHGAHTAAGYILGFPADTKESILRDVEIIKRELPLDILEFFFLTPLPGSEDHQRLLAKGVWMDPDLNKYDLNHRVTHHGKMSDAEWEDAYRAAWAAYYTDDHVKTVLRRSAVHGLRSIKSLRSKLLMFHLMIKYEGVHPLEGGALRLKFRKDRRPGMKLENPLVFYPRYGFETLRKALAYWLTIRKFDRFMKEVVEAPDREAYSDVAVAKGGEQEFEDMALYHATTGGEAALARKKRDEAIRKGAAKGAEKDVAAPAAE